MFLLRERIQDENCGFLGGAADLCCRCISTQGWLRFERKEIRRRAFPRRGYEAAVGAYHLAGGRGCLCSGSVGFAALTGTVHQSCGNRIKNG
jgi:hypothetical protein